MNKHPFILVTGAAGFVGSHVARLAKSAGLEIRTHSRRSGPGIDFSADLSDPTALRSLPWDTISTVIHCAAAIPSRSAAFARDNVEAAAALADILLEAKPLRRLVHVSSIAVYRRPSSADWLISEKAEVIDENEIAPDSYAHSKRRVEIALDDVARQRPDVSVCHLRASSIYGSGMVGTTLLPVLVRRARQNEPIVLRGPRAYRQNFVHVMDVASLALAMAGDAIGRSEPVLNAFSDDSCGLFELADLVRTVLGSSSTTVDETDDIDCPIPVFENRLAKRYHARFRSLRDNLRDIPA